MDAHPITVDMGWREGTPGYRVLVVESRKR
jgi:hypothetical protein